MSDESTKDNVNLVDCKQAETAGESQAANLLTDDGSNHYDISTWVLRIFTHAAAAALS